MKKSKPAGDNPANSDADNKVCRNKTAEHARQVLTSTGNNSWATPAVWFEYLNLEFKFDLDPCCTHKTAKCKKHYTPAEDGLAQSWAGERVFMNPPYSAELPKWLRKAYIECRDNAALVVALVPARVDTDWWHQYAAKASEIRFPIGRLTFKGAEYPAPFPVAIVVFRPRISNPYSEPMWDMPDDTTQDEYYAWLDQQEQGGAS
ncbi:MAG TPA: DNA N-6-adenine-methyltransferase [Kiritimatiellia bacterium]|nr:DNA N-6-adenine-methyltransferase [Kiritimatiellia bacterium]HRZ13548.1 DNA N-6-adenine-methyltransferase [Kiritimatiellia bacterium]HSA19147.1 DNA N-6-adenine-methyltransferase [Kiritimatiellia bacterium]